MPIRKLDTRGAALYYATLESMSRAELEKYQWARLKAQLDHVWKTNLFFRNRFDDQGITPDDIRTPEDYRKKVPLMSKKDLLADQVENPPYGDRLGVPLDKVVQTHLTSGTSGLGQEIYGCTRADVEHLGGTWAVNYHWIGVRPGDAVFHFWPLATMTAGLAAMRGLMQSGARYFLGAFFDTKTKLELMKRFDPKAILTVPAYLTTLTETAKELGFDFRRDFPSLEAVMIAAGAYPVGWAKQMEETWGAAIYEHYGSTQKGAAIAMSCEAGVYDENGNRRLLHLLEPFVYAEVLNPETLEPVKPGEAGELVITPLEREASPLLRFATADKVVLRSHADCPCGRPYDGIEAGIIERYDDMIKMKGMNVWPAAIDSVVFANEGVLDYRGRVFMAGRGKETVEMKVEFKKDVPAEERTQTLRGIAAALQERVGIRMDVHEALADSIERVQFKGKRWVDERIQGLDRKSM
ncbi:MAG: AMP-binding protein [Deltaproteobacteria bacterium]|nr:AMP-binding protein [Deltaproteobacteria bacterium]